MIGIGRDGLQPSEALGTKIFPTKIFWNCLKVGFISPKMGVLIKSFLGLSYAGSS